MNIPQPNEHGVYDKAVAEQLEFRKGNEYVVISLLEVPGKGWICARDIWLCGYGVCHGLTPKFCNGWHSDRESALRHIAAIVKQDAESTVTTTNSCISRKTRKTAAEVAAWAQQFISVTQPSLFDEVAA